MVMAPLLVVLVGYALLPAADRDYYYPFVGLLCVSVAFWGLLLQGRPRPTGWLLVLAGFLGWVLGDLIFLVEQTVLRDLRLPGPLGRGVHRVLRADGGRAGGHRPSPRLSG